MKIVFTILRHILISGFRFRPTAPIPARVAHMCAPWRWWMVQLPTDTYVVSVEVLNRDKHGERLNGFNVNVDNVNMWTSSLPWTTGLAWTTTLCASDITPSQGWTSVSCGATGNQLRISLSRYEVLTICGVRVYTAPHPPSPPPSSVATASTTLAPGNAPNSGGGESEDDADGGVSDGLIGGIVGGIIVLAAVVLAAGIGVGVYCAKKKARLASTATPASAISTPVAVTVEMNTEDKPASAAKNPVLLKLEELGLEQYAPALVDDQGYDSMDSLTGLTREQAGKIADAVKMNPGHKERFINGVA